MLWKKESKQPNASPNAYYVDISAQPDVRSIVKQIYKRNQLDIDYSKLRKDDAISLQKRKEANVEFCKQKWIGAMHLYNESLCFAEKGSENISLAYANRALCFMKMKLYNECLKDIELAKEAGYPAHLMTKLGQREANCLKEMQVGVGASNRVAKLSFEPDEKFPCMANTLKIERDTNGKNKVIAKRDLNVGQTILVEKTLKSLHFGYEVHCTICLKSKMNLVPCEKCSIAMFCSAECQESIFHEYECGVKFSNDTQFHGSTMKNFRAIVFASHLFSNVDELMEFVEETIQSDPNELPEALLDGHSTYRAFLKLRTGPEISNKELATIAFLDFKLFREHPKINAMFKSKKHRRFLMHLIAQHILISQHNSTVLKLASDTDPNRTEMNIYSAFGVMQRYFQHSCGPNAIKTFDGAANTVYVTVRPIKRGEEVLISWLPFDLNCKTKQRQEMLRLQKSFICDCRRCVGLGACADVRKIISLDTDFQSILSLDKHLKRGDDVTKVPQLIEKCTALLQRYGEFDWCYELGRVVAAFVNAYRMRFAYLDVF